MSPGAVLVIGSVLLLAGIAGAVYVGSTASRPNLWEGSTMREASPATELEAPSADAPTADIRSMDAYRARRPRATGGAA